MFAPIFNKSEHYSSGGEDNLIFNYPNNSKILKQIYLPVILVVNETIFSNVVLISCVYNP